MEAIDASVIIRGDVELSDDVVIGPQCVLDATLGPIRVAGGTRLIGNVYLNGPLTIGSDNTIYPFTCIGFAPQAVDFDPAEAGHGVRIGDHNVLREGVTIHRAMTDQGPTTIGSHNYFMTNAHAGHDVRLADHCMLATSATLGGHVVIGERVVIGGMTPVHQFCRVGRGAMLGGGLALRQDAPPFFMLTATNILGSINVVGMRRQKLSPDEIQHVRWVYKTLYRRGLPVTTALDELRTRAEHPLVAEYIDFIETSKRGLAPATPTAERRSDSRIESAEGRRRTPGC